MASAEAAPVRRQDRGRRRMDRVLDTAAEVFAETGYEKATTNAIAARAGMSPGSLYQFFRNKEAIAERYAEQIRATHDAAFDPGITCLPLGALIDRVVDPMIAFNVANPAAHVLLNGADLSPPLAARTRQLHEAALQRTEALVAARAPHLPARERARVAEVTFQVFKGLLPSVLASGRERAALVQELKAVLHRYLEPIDQQQP
jgi:AcrR family transcriptional regulator